MPEMPENRHRSRGTRETQGGRRAVRRHPEQRAAPTAWPRRRRSRPIYRDRAEVGSGTSRDPFSLEKEYELPILEELAARGGSRPPGRSPPPWGERVKDRLTELDRGTVASGDIRWENRVHFAPGSACGKGTS